MLATRGGRRPQGLYHDSDRSVGSADQCSLLNPRFEPSMATRGRRPPQHANYVRTTRTVRRPSSNYDTRGWHTNREGERAILVSHLAILCRDPKRLRAVFELRHEEGADHNGLGQRLDTTFLRARAAASSSCDTGRVPATTTIQSEAQDRVTGGFSNGRVPYTGLDTTA